MRSLNVNKLCDGQSGVSERYGGFLAEGAVISLDNCGHSSNVIISCSGSFKENFTINWSMPITSQMLDSWRDPKEATEYGATAIAILLLNQFLHFKLIRRNIGAADYIVYQASFPHSDKIYQSIYVEISGILRENKSNSVKNRIKNKVKQVEKIGMNVPYLVIVVEFQNPKAKLNYQI